MFKTFYVYDTTTFELVDIIEAQESPEELGQNKYLTPDNSTDITAPVAAEYEKAIFSTINKSWSIVPDYRNCILYDAVGNTQVITELGVNLPVGFSPVKSQALLDKEAMDAARTDRYTYIEDAYQAAIQANIDYIGYTFQADTASQDIMTKSLSSMKGVAPADFGWYDILNNKIPMTADQLQGLSNAIFLRGVPLFDYRQMCKSLIREAVYPADVVAVTWKP